VIDIKLFSVNAAIPTLAAIYSAIAK